MVCNGFAVSSTVVATSVTGALNTLTEFEFELKLNWPLLCDDWSFCIELVGGIKKSDGGEIFDVKRNPVEFIAKMPLA